MHQDIKLDLGSLRELYKSGDAHARGRDRDVYDRIAREPLEPVWISVVPREHALARRPQAGTRPARPRAPALRRAFCHQRQYRPGRPADHRGVSRLCVFARAQRHGRAGAGGRRRYPDRQDQHGSVRHRTGGHALAARRLFQRVRSAVHLGRLQFRVGGGGGQGPGEFRARHRYGGVRPRARGVQRTGRAETHARRAQHARRSARLPDAGLRLDLLADLPTTRTRCGAPRAGSIRTTASRERRAPGEDAAPWLAGGFHFGVPPAEPARILRRRAPPPRCTQQAVERMEALGGRKVEIDFSIFRAAADLLYAGPWVAERYAAIREFVEAHAERDEPGGARHHRGRAALLGRGRL